MKIVDCKNAINHHEDAINRRLYKILVIYRVSCLNRKVLSAFLDKYSRLQFGEVQINVGVIHELPYPCALFT
jgi:hypothetical protein